MFEQKIIESVLKSVKVENLISSFISSKQAELHGLDVDKDGHPDFEEASAAIEVLKVELPAAYIAASPHLVKAGEAAVKLEQLTVALYEKFGKKA